MRDTLQRLHEAKNARDVFDLISWNTLQRLAAVPFLLFSLSPVLLLLHNLFEFCYLEQTVFSINQFAGNYGTILLLLCAVKALLEHRIDRSFLREHVTLVLYAVFIMLIGLSTVVNQNAPYAMGCTWREEYFWSYILYVLVYFGCTALIAGERIKYLLIRTLQTVSLVQVCLVFLDRYLIRIEHFHLLQYERDITSVFSNRNFYGYYLAVCVLISAALYVREKHRLWRIFDMLCFLANTWTLMRADSLGCFLAAFAGIVFLAVALYLYDRCLHKKVLLLLGLFLLLFLLNAALCSDLFMSMLELFTDVGNIATNSPDAKDAGTYRWDLWTHTVQYIGERPLLGWGSEGIYDRMEQETINNQTRPHNEYLQYCAFFGIPAGLCYLGGTAAVYVRAFRHRREMDPVSFAALAGAFAYLVSAFFGNTVFSVAPYFFCVLGLAYRPAGLKKTAV